MDIDEVWHNRLKNFLYKGIERNCYKTSKQSQNWVLKDISCLTRFIENGQGQLVLKEIENSWEYSVCMEAVVFSLAACARSQNKVLRIEAFRTAAKLCQTPEELLILNRFLEDMDSASGWGRSRRSFVSNWYNQFSGKELAANVTRVVSKQKWRHSDIIKLAHVKPENPEIGLILTFLVKGMAATKLEYVKLDSPGQVSPIMEYLEAVDNVKHNVDTHVVARLIEIHNFTLEHIPTNLLKSKEIWCSLIGRLPILTLLRQLPRLYRSNLLKPNGAVTKLLVERLANESLTAKSSVDPLEFFLLLKRCDEVNRLTSKIPHQARHRRSQLDQALDALLLSSSQALTSTSKRWLVCIDVRSPMTHGKIKGCSGLSPADASAFLLTVLVQSENITTLAYSIRGLHPIDLNNKMSLTDVTKRMREIPMGPVSLWAPLVWAKSQKRPFDVIMVLTDDQVQVSEVHPAQALKEYREEMNLPNAKMIVVGMTSSEFCLAPEDYNLLVVPGFDAKVLKIIRLFGGNRF